MSKNILCICFIVLTLSLIMLSTFQSIVAQEASRNVEEYIVVRGDTLSGIAKKFGVTVKNLYEANDLKSDLIVVGQKLVIPRTGKQVKVEPSLVSPEEIPTETEKPSVEAEEPSVKTEKPRISPTKAPSLPGEPSVSPGKVNFKWAFVARTDPEGRNRIINVAEDVLSAGQANFSVTAGDKISLYVEPGESTFVYVYLLDSRKNLELIFPTGLDKNTLEKEFIPQKGTYLPGKFEWFSFDESRGKETFYIIASSKRLTKLEDLTRAYINEEGDPELAKQRVLDEIRGRKKLVAFKNPIERPLSFGGRIRGLQIDIARFAVDVEADSFYSRTIEINHE